jgi:proline iminopeptidase
MLHGGPGGQIEPRHRRVIDPERYRLIAFDQRGAGRSTPSALIEHNTTWDLVGDIESIRKHLGIERWHVTGGSWGSTLALVYAQTHPESVSAVCVWGVWLANKLTQRWLFDYGANMVYPEAWDLFVAHFSPEERADLEATTYRRIKGNDPQVAAITAKALADWETASVFFHPRDLSLMDEGDDGGESYGRIIGHYFENGCFLDGEDHIVANCGALKDIPGILIHGRFDMCTPLWEAWQLKKAWPGADLRIVEHGGHMSDEPGMATAIVKALDELADV